jgi:hypothetical protein
LRLTAPIRYLLIQHPEKNLYNFVLPIFFAAVGVAIFTLASPQPIIFGENGALKLLRDALIMAVPFMVGALASVSMGAPGKYLDNRFAGAELTLDDRILTARQFVCYLLGYLSFLGLLTLGATIVAQLFQPAIGNFLTHGSLSWYVVRWSGLSVLAILVSSLMVTTFWALYFLTDVVNRPINQQDKD